MNARMAGRAARCTGVAFDANPYRWNVYGWFVWRAAWRRADRRTAAMYKSQLDWLDKFEADMRLALAEEFKREKISG